MRLRSSPSSPFVRKIRIAASILGLQDRIDIVAADTLDPADSLRQQNPLGKIPVLVLDDGTELFDSRVILDYLDFIAGGGRIIPAGEARFPILRTAALADGILDAAILQVYEKRFRPADMYVPRWLDHQADKVARTLTVLELSPPLFDPTKPNVADITLACALGYLDFRFEGEWRKSHPNLVAWLDRFAVSIPAYEATRPS
jgi:glutathione S-transferase